MDKVQSKNYKQHGCIVKIFKLRSLIRGRTQCATGAYLLLEYSESKLALNHLRSLLDSYLRQEKYSKVVGHIGKPAMVDDALRNRLQVVLKDVGGYRGDCNDLANVFASSVRNSKLNIIREIPPFLRTFCCKIDPE